MGNLIESLDPRGTTAEVLYDANNRPYRITRSNVAQNEVVEFEYDEAGYRKRDSDSGVITEYNIDAGQYVPDPYGRINGERTLLGGDTYTVAYTYDVTGRVTGVKSPSGDWASYQYNQVGELLLVPGFINQEVQYDEVGRLASAATANGLTTAWQYDLNGRLIHKEVSDTGSTVKQYSFGYDRANNVMWKNDTRYEYDELNQLVEELREEDLQSLLFPGGVGLVYDDLFGSLPLESYHSGTELIELDYNAGSIGADLEISTTVSRIELLPDSPVHRVDWHSLELYLSEGEDEDYYKFSEWYL